MTNYSVIWAIDVHGKPVQEGITVISSPDQSEDSIVAALQAKGVSYPGGKVRVVNIKGTTLSPEDDWLPVVSHDGPHKLHGDVWRDAETIAQQKTLCDNALSELCNRHKREIGKTLSPSEGRAAALEPIIIVLANRIAELEAKGGK